MRELRRFTAEVAAEEEEPDAHEEFHRIANGVQELACSLHETPDLANVEVT
jgi:hypothetical protein